MLMTYKNNKNLKLETKIKYKITIINDINLIQIMKIKVVIIE